MELEAKLKFHEDYIEGKDQECESKNNDIKNLSTKMMD